MQRRVPSVQALFSSDPPSRCSGSQDDFISTIAQTVTWVRTYGMTFSSGALSFGAGYSYAEIQKLLESRVQDETDI